MKLIRLLHRIPIPRLTFLVLICSFALLSWSGSGLSHPIATFREHRLQGESSQAMTLQDVHFAERHTSNTGISSLHIRGNIASTIKAAGTGCCTSSRSPESPLSQPHALASQSSTSHSTGPDSSASHSPAHHSSGTSQSLGNPASVARLPHARPPTQGPTSAPSSFSSSPQSVSSGSFASSGTTEWKAGQWSPPPDSYSRTASRYHSHALPLNIPGYAARAHSHPPSSTGKAVAPPPSSPSSTSSSSSRNSPGWKAGPSGTKDRREQILQAIQMEHSLTNQRHTLSIPHRQPYSPPTH